ncbi:MAG: cysteine desulfurase family protein [Dehalococcoidia bacterium]
MNRRIYLDHAATTPVDPRVIDAMLPYLTTHWGNPSGIYQEAREARAGLDSARRAVAASLGAKPNEIVFTGGGSESGQPRRAGGAATRRRGDHVITTAIEHHAVLHTVQALEREGRCQASYVGVDGEGFVDLDALAAAVTDRTVLVSVMYANNEVGTIQPLAEVVRTVKRRNPRVIVHTDAVTAAGTLDLTVDQLGVDLLTIAAHKCYGPKGIGALYVRGRTPLSPQVLGGGQERDRRAGTENVAGRRLRPRSASPMRNVTVATRTPPTCATGCWTNCRRAYRACGSTVRATAPVAWPTTSTPAWRALRVKRCCSNDMNGVAASRCSACTTAR